MLLSEIEFGAFLAYSPHGTDQAAEDSRGWTSDLNSDRVRKFRGQGPLPISRLVARRMRSQLQELPFAAFFASSPLLVPVPSSGLRKPGSIWVPLRLAEAFRDEGLASEVRTALERRIPVRRSATAAPSERPKADEHFRSLRCQPSLNPPEEILLIDDVVTRGATLLAAASRLRQAFPRATIRAFAVMRTISNPAEFASLRDPCVGRIELRRGETFRRP